MASLSLFLALVIFFSGQKSAPALSPADHLVTNLPFQPSHYVAKHYAGHIPVNNNSSALFYWFYEATSNAKHKPLVLWLNGGPGCSSLGYGATQEIGPFVLTGNTEHGLTGIHLNHNSWNTEANILFLESPIGVGYSYSKTRSNYKQLDDDMTANDTYDFLLSWLATYPDYIERPFYLAGESYSGIVIPVLARKIHQENHRRVTKINLKGILLGNPETDFEKDWTGLVDYTWSHSIISDDLNLRIKNNCDFRNSSNLDKVNCNDVLVELFGELNKIDIYSIYTPLCVPDDGDDDDVYMFERAKFHGRTNKVLRMRGTGYDPCLDRYAKVYYNREDVQESLHVLAGEDEDTMPPMNWKICNYELFNYWNYLYPSVLPLYKELIDAGYRIWLYSGDADARVSTLSTRYSINGLRLNVIKKWDAWFYNETQLAGWVLEYEGLDFITFRGAGHAVPLFKRPESLFLFKNFLLGKSLSSAS